MSYSVDVNILLYASDRTSPQHAAAIKFLQYRADDSEVFLSCLAGPHGLPTDCHASSIFREPLSPGDALGNIEVLLRLPQVRLLHEEEGFLQVYREVTDHLAARGNLVPDAHLAALLRQHHVRRLYTSDADFKKFDALDVRNPFV